MTEDAAAGVPNNRSITQVKGSLSLATQARGSWFTPWICRHSPGAGTHADHSPGTKSDYRRISLYSLLDCTDMCVLSHVRLFATPWTTVYQAPLSMGFSRQEYWSGFPFSSPGIFPTQGLNPGHLHCRHMLLLSEPPGKPGVSTRVWPQVNNRDEHSPTHQQTTGLKIYWAWPRPSEQDPVYPSVNLSHQEVSISHLSFSIRGQTDWKPQSEN